MTCSKLEQRVRERLEFLDSAAGRRELRPPEGIDFSSNDYLGLASHPIVAERMAQAAIRGGCGSTGSRLLRGERPIFAGIEHRFAAFKGTERALYFGSGYLANLGVLASFLDPGDTVFSDELNHASLIDGLRLSRARRIVFPHCDVRALKRLLENETAPGQKFLVTESLFSMDGDEAPLPEYAALCSRTGTALIVDEAHAVGIYGERGSGLIEATGTGDGVFLSINPAGKALGACGAFVAGPAWAIEYLVQTARTFIFSTAPPPAVAAALDAALDLIAGEPQRRRTLMEFSAYLRSALSEHGIRVPPGRSQIIPVIVGGNERASAVASGMREAGFDVRAIRPPAVPEGTARLRISVNVNLNHGMLSRFAAALASVYKNQ